MRSSKKFAYGNRKVNLAHVWSLLLRVVRRRVRVVGTVKGRPFWFGNDRRIGDSSLSPLSSRSLGIKDLAVNFSRSLRNKDLELRYLSFDHLGKIL